MLELNPPRAIPDRPHYFTIDLENRPAHHFRVPSLSKSAKLIRFVQASGVVDNATDADFLAANLPEILAVQGAVIGQCWYNAAATFEAKPADFPSLGDYGEQIQEELHEAGYKLAELNTMWAALVDRLVSSFVDSQTVEEQENFTEAPTDSTT